MKENEIYFDSLAGAVDGIIVAAENARALLTRPSEVWALAQDRLAYGQTRRGDFSLDLLRDKPTRKFFHATICRLDSGRYELTTFIR